jgi:large subunit ribosomal protein L24
MKIKKADNVIVIAGKDKGKTGKVLKVMPKDNLIVVEGLNLQKKHKKAVSKDKKGQMIELSAPLHISNVMLVVDGKGVRVGSKVVGDKKVRVSKKTGKTV